MPPVPSRSQSGDLTLLKDVLNLYSSEFGDDYQAVIHGVVPPIETPLSWLAYHCAHADNFLYIVLTKNKKKT